MSYYIMISSTVERVRWSLQSSETIMITYYFKRTPLAYICKQSTVERIWWSFSEL